MEKIQFCQEGITNTFVILIDLFYNKTEIYHEDTAIWYNTGIIGKSQVPNQVN